MWDVAGAPIKTVAVIGGTGDLGHVIVGQIAAAGDFHVTVVARNPSSKRLLPDVKTVSVGYESPKSIRRALQGFDAVVNALPGHLEEIHLRILDAAIFAGVGRYIPSEFGSDHRQPAAQSIPLSATKIKVDDVVQKAAAEGRIEYTSLLGGLWLEWSMGAANCMSVPQRHLVIHDGGNLRFGITTRKAFGDAVVGVLRHPDETKNQVITIEVISLTQNRILELVQEAFPGEQFEVSHMETLKRYERGEKRLFQGDFDISVVTDIVVRFVFDPELQLTAETENANELLGVKRITEEEFKEIIKRKDELLKQ
ncbi:hypothetical protein QQX98_000409 [Neonectria punicea]|uniref:NmrA-like domain-containing protein n=1 Tax=Neonectria punicea TaxID=979145 RepID=A0ABR1HUD8_9HYPO